MFFNTALYVSLAIFGLGLVYKISTWFRYSLGADAKAISPSARVLAAIKGTISTLFSIRILTLIRVFILDVLLQVRILRDDSLRWFMHVCIYGGFGLLLLMHALGSIVTSAVVAEYYSIMNPFLFLRDLSAGLVILGSCIALYRRFIERAPRRKSNAMDLYAIAALMAIVVSGVFLESTKITSYAIFRQMAEDYGVLDDEDDLRALEAYWVAEYGVVSPDPEVPLDSEVFEKGQVLHDDSCGGCHSRLQWAFIGYSVSRGLPKPIAIELDRASVHNFLWYVHFLLCFFGLAYLPFSKFFHVFAAPLSLLSNAVMEKATANPANIATRQVMELDACTHCSTCSMKCAVAIAFEEIPNLNILPSEKIASIKTLAAGKKMSALEIRALQEGVYLCSNCYRCTVNCPAGINLQDLWFNVRETLLREGFPELLVLSPFSFYRGCRRDNIDPRDYQEPLVRAKEAIAEEYDSARMKDKLLPLTPDDGGVRRDLKLSVQAHNFSLCFACKTCTTACPVVDNYDKPQEKLGLLPHQIMRAAGLGLGDLALGSDMLFSCLGCYQCQEHCPQGVYVTDVLYELKNTAIQQAKEKLWKQVEYRL